MNNSFTHSIEFDLDFASFTGVIAPGLIWAGQYFQIGAEAIIPYGQGQGHGVGALVQFHLFLDDLFPRTIGKPLFAR